MTENMIEKAELRHVRRQLEHAKFYAAKLDETVRNQEAVEAELRRKLCHAELRIKELSGS